MEQKKDIRKQVLTIRKHISKKEWEEKSRVISSKVITHPFFLNADTIYCYVDYKNEVGTRAIIEEAWKLGKRVAVPKIVEDEMLFYYIESYSDLAEGYKGIPEPNTEECACTEEGLVIMPGVAFDYNRHRLGYGKGFYDRYLCTKKQLCTLAICFECQMVEDIPTDKYDIFPEVLITEERTYVE